MGVKKLGFGLARLPLTDPNDDSKIDIDLTKKLVDEFIKSGFSYFDTAYMYHNYQSEYIVRKVLTERYPREKFCLASKLPPLIHAEGDCERIFREQKDKTGVDFFDYYLLHNVGLYHYQMFQEFDCFRWMVEKKEQGSIKNIGFSFHDRADLLDKILTEHPEMEFVQLQINYLDWDNEGIQSRKCYEVARKHDKPVIIMEPIKGGTLANVPEKVEKIFKKRHPDMSIASWAMRFAAGLDNVIMVLSGMSNMEQLLNNIWHMKNYKPLDEGEKAIIQKAVNIINQSIEIPCTGCSYCTVECPKHIAIPQYFYLYNSYKQEMEGKFGTPYEEYYDGLTRTFGKAGDCVGCRQCEKACPQHLPITEYLKKIAAHYEK